MYSNVLVPVDVAHEDVARRILALCPGLIGETGRLIVLHALTEIPAYADTYVPAETREARKAEAKAMVEALVAEAGIDPGRAQVQVVTGAAHDHILSTADEMGCDLIVIGSHRPGLSDYLIGSTAARVVRHAQCSVLVDR